VVRVTQSYDRGQVLQLKVICPVHADAAGSAGIHYFQQAVRLLDEPNKEMSCV
jgi:hypothetical protein